VERPASRLALAIVMSSGVRMDATSPVADSPRSADRSTEKILVASDGGPASAAALRWAIDRLSDRAAEVEIVNVVDPAASDAAERRRSVHGMARLLELLIPSVSARVTDDAADPLDVLSRSRDAILVVGAHRHDRRRSTFAELAVLRAQGLVVVVPSEWICREGPVMVGIGAEDDTTATLAFAEREAAARHVDVRLIHTWATTGPGEIPPEWDFGTESIPERQRRALERLADGEQQSHPGLTVTAEVMQGQVVARLADAARTASLLVVGRSHRPAIMRAMFGSTAAGLLAVLPCPVAVVP
jgi:nucleotide-binding universal stress UspA family protein